jgi:hypothetical protein
MEMGAGALATVTDYNGLIEALKARQAEIGITNATLEALTGLQPGYVGTLFGSSRGRSLGGTSFGLLLGGLALKLIVVEDLDAARRMEKRWEQRIRPLVLNGGQHKPVEIKFTRRHMRKIAKKAVAARMEKMTPAKRRRVARKAAKSRWKQHRAKLAARAAHTSAAALPQAPESLSPLPHIVVPAAATHPAPRAMRIPTGRVAAAAG